MPNFSRAEQLRISPTFRAMAIGSIMLAALTSCQSSSTPTSTLESASDVTAESVDNEVQSAENAASTPATAETENRPVEQAAANDLSTGQCTIQLAGGPPPKPARGADFGQAVAKNTGKAVQRGIIQRIGGAIGGGLGSAIAGNVAHGTIRQEQDIKGVWLITDGSPQCACEVSVDSLYKLKGKGADSGFSKNRGCSSVTLQQVAAWTLGYSFSGYDSKFELKAKDKTTVLATLNRDGIHYFSGTLSDGTPVVMWREKQTFNQLPAFNKSLR